MDSSEAIGPDDYILRRVFDFHLRPDMDAAAPDAFAPRMPKKADPGDDDGLSVYLERLHSIEDVGVNLRGKGKTPSFVLRIPASEIVDLGLTIQIKPIPKEECPRNLGQPGHCIIPELRVETANDDSTERFKRLLAGLVTKGRIHGPFKPRPTAG